MFFSSLTSNLDLFSIKLILERQFVFKTFCCLAIGWSQTKFSSQKIRLRSLGWGEEDRGHKLFSVYIGFKQLRHFHTLTWAFPLLIWDTDTVIRPLKELLQVTFQFSVLGKSVMLTPPKELPGPISGLRLDCCNTSGSRLLEKLA